MASDLRVIRTASAHVRPCEPGQRGAIPRAEPSAQGLPARGARWALLPLPSPSSPLARVQRCGCGGERERGWRGWGYAIQGAPWGRTRVWGAARGAPPVRERECGGPRGEPHGARARVLGRGAARERTPVARPARTPASVAVGPRSSSAPAGSQEEEGEIEV